MPKEWQTFTAIFCSIQFCTIPIKINTYSEYLFKINLRKSNLSWTTCAFHCFILHNLTNFKFKKGTKLSGYNISDHSTSELWHRNNQQFETHGNWITVPNTLSCWESTPDCRPWNQLKQPVWQMYNISCYT